MWASSPPIWVSPQPFQKTTSSKHKDWNVYVSFHLFRLFCLGAPLQMYTVLSLHSQPLSKQKIFLPSCSSACTPHFLTSTHESAGKMSLKWKDCFAVFCSFLTAPFLTPTPNPLVPLAPSPITSSLLLCLTTAHSFSPSLTLLSHLSFLLPPLRLSSSQRDRDPPDLPDWCERQRSGANTPGGPSVRACTPQLQDQHHGIRCWRRPQRGPLRLRAAFFPCQRSPQLDHFQAER